ncbi:MAG: hypothetical protein IJY92_06200 [Alphaproteobacteria bacterium]|nr:hypothetical protein [Alphaproteobacteria bacterium]
MDKKTILSLCCVATALTSCGDNKANQKSVEAELNQEAVLLTCDLKRHSDCLYAWMTFDTDGDYSKPEYAGFTVYEQKAISESAVDQYHYELSQLKVGSKATLRTWSGIIRNIARVKE